MTNDNFSLWLIREMETRGWSYSETARRGGISHARISQVVGGETPGAEFCLAIARAFKMEPEDVLKRAGRFPPEPPVTSRRREADRLFARLSEEDQETLLVQMRALAERQVRYAVDTEPP